MVLAFAPRSSFGSWGAPGRGDASGVLVLVAPLSAADAPARPVENPTAATLILNL
jgi:hypothetical protein